jgi:hypothetical protein
MKQTGENRKILKDRFLWAEQLRAVFTGYILMPFKDVLVTQRQDTIKNFEHIVRKLVQRRF